MNNPTPDTEGKPVITRKQFTRHDREELHPECANANYLEYERVGNEIISYGYMETYPDSHKYRWVPLREALPNNYADKLAGSPAAQPANLADGGSMGEALRPAINEAMDAPRDTAEWVQGTIEELVSSINAEAKRHDQALKSQLLAAVGEDLEADWVDTTPEDYMGINSERARFRAAINTVYKENK